MPADPAAPPIAADDDPGGRTARRLVGVVVLAAVAPVLYLLASPHNFYDLRIYMRAMDWWVEGNPIYDYVQPDPVQGELYFTYPPFAALLLRPFALLHINVTITIFTLLTIAAVLVTTWWLVVPVAARHATSRWFAVAVAVPLVFAAESTRETITFGQINMLLGALCASAMAVAPSRTRTASWKRSAGSGCRQRETIASSAAGTRGLRRRTGSGAPVCRAATSARVIRCAPASIS